MMEAHPVRLGGRGAPLLIHAAHPRPAGNTVIYIADGGSGGSGSAATCTGLGGSNGWLQLAYERVSPVRVIRSHRLRQSPYAPVRGLRYDGTYHVSRMEHVPRGTGELCLKFTFERIKGQSRLPLRVAPATAASSNTRHARRPVFVDLMEPDERPAVWAISPAPDGRRGRAMPQDSFVQDTANVVPQARQASVGSERVAGGAQAAGIAPSRTRERPPMPTVRRAARGFPQAGVIGSPSAPRLGSALPSHGYRQQVRHCRPEMKRRTYIYRWCEFASRLSLDRAPNVLHCQTDRSASP
jgi:hypothetical protein